MAAVTAVVVSATVITPATAVLITAAVVVSATTLLAAAAAVVAAAAASLLPAHEARSALRRAALPGHLEQVLEPGPAGLRARKRAAFRVVMDRDLEAEFRRGACRHRERRGGRE